MTTRPLIVNKEDRRRLIEAIDAARSSWSTYGPYLDWLAMQLDQATAVDADDVPADVVTMDSSVELSDLRTGRSQSMTLVYVDQQRKMDTVPIFHPAGLALLGSRVGDVVTWHDGDDSCTALLERLTYQPEAAGVR